MVERVIGNDEVSSSNLLSSSINPHRKVWVFAIPNIFLACLPGLEPPTKIEKRILQGRSQTAPAAYSSKRVSASVWAKSLAAASASSSVLPQAPTSNSMEPVRTCWLNRLARMDMGRMMPG